VIEQVKQHLQDWEAHCRVIQSHYAYAEITPQAKQSMEMGRGRQKFGKLRSFTPAKKKKYVKDLAEKLKESYTGPKLRDSLRLSVIYCFPWRSSDFQSLGWVFKPTRPDCDNLWKPLADAMQDVMFFDDAQIVESRARKIYAGWCGIAVRLDEIVPKRVPKK
jgi:Holliday junction resolvase RusA-like endonuclease